MGVRALRSTFLRKANFTREGTAIAEPKAYKRVKKDKKKNKIKKNIIQIK